MSKYAYDRLFAQDNNFLLWIVEGFNADPDIVPDLDRFTAMMRGSLERVAAAAGVALAPKPASGARPAKQAEAPAAPRANGNGPVAAT